jgi:alpha-N-arabinofuranosidase
MLFLRFVTAPLSFGQVEASLTIDTTKPIANVSLHLYGIMTKEINYSYDGGLYS